MELGWSGGVYLFGGGGGEEKRRRSERHGGRRRGGGGGADPEIHILFLIFAPTKKSLLMVLTDSRQYKKHVCECVHTPERAPNRRRLRTLFFSQSHAPRHQHDHGINAAGSDGDPHRRVPIVGRRVQISARPQKR